MFIKILDVIVLMMAIYFAITWGNLHGYQAWIVGLLIFATNLVSFFRAHVFAVEQIKS